MGLFGSIFKGIGKVVGGVAKVATGALRSGLLPIPGGGLIGKAAGLLLNAKQPMATTATKLQLRDPRVMRGNLTQSMGHPSQYFSRGIAPPPSVLRMSPVLPGGAIATTRGPAPRSAAPPATYTGGTGRAAPTKRRRRRKGASSAAGTRRRKGRKLKFGSPAWRKKYLGQGKRRRRKRAA